MNIICSDLEGVFIPEIWINVAEKTGIEELKLTTRDITDYNELMKKRLSVMDDNGLKLQDITEVIKTIDPLEGAYEALNWIRERSQIIILSDTFEEFAMPIMKKLGYPVVFCHSLSIDADGRITDYHLRQQNQKKHGVRAFQALNYKVTAFGDSYNDTAMLKEADNGFFFNPPRNVSEEFPEFPVVKDYEELKVMLKSFI